MWAPGYPVVDIRVTLIEGKAHSVDSSDFAFQMAGSLALREAASATKVNLLEPVDVVSVVVPDDFVGAVMSDLAGRRGRVIGTDKVGEDRTVVNAEIPEVELTRYAIDLRSLAHGAGSFTRSFARYEPMPEHAAAKVKASPRHHGLATAVGVNRHALKLTHDHADAEDLLQETVAEARGYIHEAGLGEVA